jgi:hypothetical protein
MPSVPFASRCVVSVSVSSRLVFSFDLSTLVVTPPVRPVPAEPVQLHRLVAVTGLAPPRRLAVDPTPCLQGLARRSRRRFPHRTLTPAAIVRIPHPIENPCVGSVCSVASSSEGSLVRLMLSIHHAVPNTRAATSLVYPFSATRCRCSYIVDCN